VPTLEIDTSDSYVVDLKEVLAFIDAV